MINRKKEAQIFSYKGKNIDTNNNMKIKDIDNISKIIDKMLKKKENYNERVEEINKHQNEEENIWPIKTNINVDDLIKEYININKEKISLTEYRKM